MDQAFQYRYKGNMSYNAAFYQKNITLKEGVVKETQFHHIFSY